MMRSHLQLGSEVTCDLVLYAENTKIRLYGFTSYPFLLPSFLTNRVFALEFARQRVHTEKEHFLNNKKGCNINFHYTIGPFVIKSSQTIQILTEILESMKLQRAEKMNYDPKGVMDPRKKACMIQAFKHQEIAGMAKRENEEVFSLEQPSVYVVEQSNEILYSSKINTATTLVIPTPTTNEKGTKRNHE